LNDIVTAGSCPKWLMLSGPTLREIFTIASSGTSEPLLDRTYSTTSVITWYSFEV
jgi:hypothetical protein